MDKIGKVAGGMNAHTADFTALCAPEALPERIGLCSYFIEYAFVHDDVSVDAVQGAKTVSRRHGLDIEMILGLPFSPGKCLEGNKTLSKALGPERYEDLRAIMDGGLKRKQSRAKIWSALREIDQDYLSRCQSTFKQWYETGRQMRDQTFASLENYLAVRALDCGANWVVRMIGWASGVELTQEEEIETGPVTYLAFVVLAVTNDIWSWEKEKKVTRYSGESLPLINAVQMVIQMQQVDEDTAKHRVLDIIRQNEKQYCFLRDDHLNRPNTSHSVRKWFQILELSMAGNALWSIHSPRYHLDVRNPYNSPSVVPSVFKGLQIMQSRSDGGKTEKTQMQSTETPIRCLSPSEAGKGRDK
jgi:hypothetical protein